MTVQTITVPDDTDGLRLDRFLVSLMPTQSRSQIQRLIREGRVTGPGRFRASTPVRAGERYAVDVPAIKRATPEPEALPLRIDAARGARRDPEGARDHPGEHHQPRGAKQCRRRYRVRTTLGWEHRSSVGDSRTNPD